MAIERASENHRTRGCPRRHAPASLRQLRRLRRGRPRAARRPARRWRWAPYSPGPIARPSAPRSGRGSRAW